MSWPTQFSRRSRNRLFTAFAIFATAAQLVVALLPLTEGRVARTLSAHVEADGAKGHVAHNEATCASCQARSIQGATSRAVFPIPESTVGALTAVASVERFVSAAYHPQAHPRAPPTVI
ncbi:MAG: hypothetical protein JWM41_802 [Gemmatimonadetes bacterium]|nr:hypothetical protein [Gemmatimonadota bacterium]